MVCPGCGRTAHGTLEVMDAALVDEKLTPAKDGRAGRNCRDFACLAPKRNNQVKCEAKLKIPPEK